ncbi:helix-turn-helix transcriptional regulator [Marinobacterium marinum]|uniref:Helix-turn-helix transcriptional regulator n=1 Tax=Marinobacterium marinum TaxID=2756129 RepID=A0A7W1WYC5_9GAMM|nr:AraC family transcriptional regulator [Marinobacterium marinum]MBA4502312.1 helix-turn-helix transcriptional regulator [Marinobacterium marinum]
MKQNALRLGLDIPKDVSDMGEGWRRLQLPIDLGHCYSDHLELESGLSLVRVNYQPKCHLIEETACPHKERVLVITLGLTGESDFHQTNQNSLAFKAGHTTITTFSNTPGERVYQANTPVSQLRLIVNEPWLQRYLGAERCEQVLGNGHLYLLSNHSSTSNTRTHALALSRHIQTDMHHSPNKLNTHIHALSILCEQLDGIAPENLKSQASLNVHELERIERARQLMSEHLETPLTLASLSQQVSLSQHKLKQGFKQLYDTTPSQMLTELRMQKAYTLLTTGHQVAQAAWMVGYRYPNNFSVAFTRYFGRSPKSVMGHNG